ncbi:MAG: PadR family transcriptional regulator [Euryarchaeota archaeon]|nr:PadR family transcriptional regulator [Euryarchaeota archaeon]
MLGKGYIYKGSKISPSQFLMIVVLRNGPMYGYEILKALREEFSGLWEPQTGALYPALKRLEEHGLLAVDNVGGKDYYRLTDEGKRWMDETLGKISTEVRFLSRYVEFLSGAIPEPGRTAVEDDAPKLSWHLLHLVEDSPDGKALGNKKLVRAMLVKKVREIDKEISDIEKEGKQ